MAIVALPTAESLERGNNDDLLFPDDDIELRLANRDDLGDGLLEYVCNIEAQVVCSKKFELNCATACCSEIDEDLTATGEGLLPFETGSPMEVQALALASARADLSEAAKGVCGDCCEPIISELNIEYIQL